MTTILLIEDEPAIADAARYALEREGWVCQWAATLAAARAHLAQCEAIVLDVGLPDGNGFDFCRELRRTSQVPVMFLTSRADEVDRIIGLELGADDYIAKPFSPRELAARIKAVLRRCRAPSPAEFVGLHLDSEARRAVWHGRILGLTRYEFRLLEVLAGDPGRVFSRDDLLDQVWEDPAAAFDRTVDTHIKTLRAKLRNAAPTSDPIRTLRGEGYAWQVP